MPDLDLVPRPTRLHVREGGYTLTPRTGLCAPDVVATLVRDLVYPFPSAGPADAGLVLTEVADPELGAEGYRMSVDGGGVRAGGTATGLCWAVQTLRQLLPPAAGYATPGAAGDVPSGAAGDARWPLPCVEIMDVPRYAWRGALLDVARWYQPVEFLYRFVDLLAIHKLNTLHLHLHLTDDQGWRFEVLRYPRLTEVGGYRRESNRGHLRQRRLDGTPHGGWYPQAQLRDLVAYAARRGVRVMPEIDVPGHMQAAIAAYPELGNEPGRQLAVRTSWGVSSHILNVSDSTLRFVTDVLDEVLEVFPFELVHLGGDEVPPDEWAASLPAAQRVRSASLSCVDDLLGWWSRQAAAHLAGRGRRSAVWDEVLEHEPTAGTAIFAWRDASRVAAARAAGYEVVAVPQEYTYLDWAESDGPDEPLAINAPLPLSRVYGYQPGQVSGVQGQLWTEYLPTPRLIEWRAFPRLAALAEVGWTSGPRPFPEFRERLRTHLRRLDVLGVTYRPLG